MANFLKYKISKILFSYNESVIEIYGALNKIVWALYLLPKQPAFTTVSGYAAVTQEKYFGWTLLIVGIFHFASIAAYHLGWRKALFFRRWFTFVGLLFWFFTVVLLSLQFGRVTAILIPYGLLSLFMFLNFVKLWLPDDKPLVREINSGRPLGMAERRA